MDAEAEAREVLEKGIQLAKSLDYAGALTAFDRAIALKSGFAEAWHNRGGALRDLGKDQEALASYDQAIRYKLDYYELDYPGVWDVWVDRATLLWALKQYKEAVKSFDSALKSLKYGPYEYGAAVPSMLWEGRGLVLLEMGEHKKALESFDKALKQSWHNPDDLVYRGQALVALQKYQEAIESYERALEHGAGNSEAWEGKNNALDLLERWLKARRPPKLYTELYELVASTEERLHLFIRQRLQRAFGKEEAEWWSQGVPLGIRQKCAQRREEDPRRRPLYNYTDLIDLKDILDKNWKLFELDLQQVKGQIKSKREFLDNLVRLNDIRKTVMHPVRDTPTEDDLNFASVVQPIFR